MDRNGRFGCPRVILPLRLEICEFEHGFEVTELRSRVADLKAKLDNVASLGPWEELER